MVGKYQNKIDGSIIEIYEAVQIEGRIKTKILLAKFIQSQTMINCPEFKITENFNKFETWIKI